VPQWNKFSYDVAAPPGTSVEFRLRASQRSADGTCGTLAAVTTSPPTPIASVSTSGDPQACTVESLTSGCPKDLYEYLARSQAENLPCLQMDAYGIPSGSTTPQIYDWKVLYDCVDYL
jgi:hypothetical protein